MDVEIRTLTPLWTGGADAAKVDRVHETGVLGSLRWWYETMVRGLGGWACDPTRHECQYDPEKPNHGLCDVCKVFGATGWRRRFRLTIVDRTQVDKSSPRQISANRTNPNTGRDATWWFPDHPRTGRLVLRIQSMSPGFSPQAIAGLLQFMADWAALGAKAQMGFGVFAPTNGRLDTQSLYEQLSKTSAGRPDHRLPSLQNVFLARIHVPNATDRDTFNLKYDLRQCFAGQQDKGLRHFVMGTVHGGRMAAKVKVSRPYSGGLMRVWGWIPDAAGAYRGTWSRSRIVDQIHQHLADNYTLQIWREMNSSRDTIMPRNSDAKVFLQSLLDGQEEVNAA